jgi:hypothetical protein
MSENQENDEDLIKTERDIMATLKKMFNDPDLSKMEKVRVADALAYHAVVLNKLRSRKNEESQYDEDSLGDFIAGMHFADGPMRRLVRRDFRNWKRRLSSTR